MLIDIEIQESLDDNTLRKEHCLLALETAKAANKKVFDKIFNDKFSFITRGDIHFGFNPMLTVSGFTDFWPFFRDKQNMISQPPKEDIEVRFLRYNYNGELLDEIIPESSKSLGGELLSWHLIYDSNIARRTKVVVVSNFDGKTYSNYQWNSEGSFSGLGIYGIVAPSNSGKVEILDDDGVKKLEYQVINGAFGTDNVPSEQRNIAKNLIGKINVIYKGDDGNVLERTIYKYTPNRLVILSDFP